MSLFIKEPDTTTYFYMKFMLILIEWSTEIRILNIYTTSHIMGYILKAIILFVFWSFSTWDDKSYNTEIWEIRFEASPVWAQCSSLTLDLNRHRLDTLCFCLLGTGPWDMSYSTFQSFSSWIRSEYDTVVPAP